MTLAEFRKVFHGPLVGNCGYNVAVELFAHGGEAVCEFGVITLASAWRK